MRELKFSLVNVLLCEASSSSFFSKHQLTTVKVFLELDWASIDVGMLYYITHVSLFFFCVRLVVVRSVAQWMS